MLGCRKFGDFQQSEDWREVQAPPSQLEIDVWAAQPLAPEIRECLCCLHDHDCVMYCAQWFTPMQRITRANPACWQELILKRISKHGPCTLLGLVMTIGAPYHAVRHALAVLVKAGTLRCVGWECSPGRGGRRKVYDVKRGKNERRNV